MYEDRSGDLLAELITEAGHDLVRREVVADDRAGLGRLIATIADAGDVALVVTTGGTGISPTDRTPEATTDVCDRLVPGIAEAVRARSMAVTPHGALSRGVCGVRGVTLIVNLPGSPGGARDGWSVIAPIVEHAATQLRGGDHPQPQG